MSTLTDRLDALKQRAQDIASQLVALTDKRRSFSFSAASGDHASAKQIADIDVQCDDLAKLHQTTLSAIEVGEGLAKQHALEAEQKKERDKDIAAYTAARAVIALSEEIDLALQKLAEQCARRQSLLAELLRCQAIEESYHLRSLLSKLAGKGPLTRASQHAGLHNYLSLQTVAPGSATPLAEGNSILLGIGQAPEAEPERVRLKAKAVS
jgi:hypothetical protein